MSGGCRWVQVAPNCLPFLMALRPPMFEAMAFHEQSGAFVHAWAAVGIRAASVANRPAALPPVAQSAHFIAGVQGISRMVHGTRYLF